MTNQEALRILHCPSAYLTDEDSEFAHTIPLFSKAYGQAMAVAFEALKHADVLDKIRAEIIEEKDCAYADFERYKVDYLGQDWEDVLDSLPQDDFRYGMERAIEILDKYKAESEGRGDLQRV